MKLTWEELRSLVTLLWISYVIKRMLIVLMVAPFGNTDGGKSLHRFPVVTVTTQAVLWIRVHGGTTINKWWSHIQFVAKPFKRPLLAPLPSKELYCLSLFRKYLLHHR